MRTFIIDKQSQIADTRAACDALFNRTVTRTKDLPVPAAGRRHMLNTYSSAIRELDGRKREAKRLASDIDVLRRAVTQDTNELIADATFDPARMIEVLDLIIDRLFENDAVAWVRVEDSRYSFDGFIPTCPGIDLTVVFWGADREVMGEEVLMTGDVFLSANMRNRKVASYSIGEVEVSLVEWYGEAIGKAIGEAIERVFGGVKCVRM